MPTTVHIPPRVLESVDAEARKRKISRNRFIVEALVARVALERGEARWPASFFADMKRWRDNAAHLGAVRDLKKAVRSSRRNKKTLSL
jgi:hypothetical protein